MNVFLDCNLATTKPEDLPSAVQTIFQQLEDQLNNIAVPELQDDGTITDTQHGPRSGGNLHPTATTTVAGFMSAGDRIQLAHYKGDTSAAGPATTTQYPADGDWGFHTDTVGTTYKLAKNKAGTIFTTPLT